MVSDKNILVSGWPGAGATTISLLLSTRLDKKLLRGTETFRFIGKELKKSDTGTDRIDNDNYLEPHFGPIFDKYIDHKLVEGKNLIVEADIGGFRLGKNPNFFSIFVMADKHERIQRLGSDGRDADQAVLEKRESDLRDRYEELHGIDWFSLDEINEKYDLVLDNSILGIADELFEIYKSIYTKSIIDTEEFEMLSGSKEEDDALYWERGKDWYVKELNSLQKIIEAPEILREINKLFSEKVEALPDNIKQIIKSQ